MKICAIICEYNPLHNGHLLHIEQTKKLTSCDALITIMSGNFTQRGEPAILNKYTRAKEAILAGADIVLELPTIYALSNAEKFAFGAIKILREIDGIEYLSFGSELEDIDNLSQLADFLLSPPTTYTCRLKTALSEGNSFAKSQSIALTQCIDEGNLSISTQLIQDISSSPNSILAIEYIKSMKKLQTNFAPLAIKRVGGGYNEGKLTGALSSATAIRAAITSGEWSSILQAVPSYTAKDLEPLLDCQSNSNQTLSNLILYKLRSMTTNQISKLYEVTEGLEHRIKSMSEACGTLDELLAAVKTKRYTLARLRRILIYALLDITHNLVSRTDSAIPYAKVLALKSTRADLLSHIAGKRLKLLTNSRDYKDIQRKSYARSVDLDIRASQIHSIITNQPTINDISKRLEFI